MTNEPTVQYRPIIPADRRSIARLGTQAFGLLGAFFVKLESGGWIAEAGPGIPEIAEGTAVGAIVLKRFTAKSEPLGLVSWIMSHPKARGLGIAGELRRLGDRWFAEQGIDKTFATIEQYNQSSSKLFAAAGYRPLGLLEQVKLFGGRIVPIWLKSLVVIALSHVLWYRDLAAPTGVEAGAGSAAEAGVTAAPPRRATAPTAGFVTALVFQSLVFVLLMARWRLPLGLGEIILAAATITAIILIARTVPFLLASRAAGLPTRYSAWSGGAPLAIVVSAVAGGFIPYPGSLYPRQSQYNYQAMLPALGLGSLLGAVGLLGLLVGVRLVRLDPGLPQWVHLSHEMLRAMVPVYVIVDVLIPAFPFSGYLGRQVYLWKRWVWVLLALIAVGVLGF